MLVANNELTNLMATSSLVLMLVPKKYWGMRGFNMIYHDKYLQRLHIQVFWIVYTCLLLVTP
jgi:hypothetical protein